MTIIDIYTFHITNNASDTTTLIVPGAFPDVEQLVEAIEALQARLDHLMEQTPDDIEADYQLDYYKGQNRILEDAKEIVRHLVGDMMPPRALNCVNTVEARAARVNIGTLSIERAEGFQF